MTKRVYGKMLIIAAIAMIAVFLLSYGAYAIGGGIDDLLNNDARGKKQQEDKNGEETAPAAKPEKTEPATKDTTTKDESKKDAQDANRVVNIRLANELNKMDRFITANFFKGYNLIGRNITKKAGGGILGGDCSLRKIYYNKAKDEYTKLVKDNKLMKTDGTTMMITVDIYPDKKAAEKNLANFGMKESEKKIGDGTWTYSMKVDPAKGPKKDNYNALQLVVLKNNVQIHLLASNYVSEPSKDDWSLMQEAARKIADKVK